MPLFSQSPYRVGSGPFGPPDSFAAGLAFAAASCLRASASANARIAAGDSGLRCSADADVAGREESFVISESPAGLTILALFDSREHHNKGRARTVKSQMRFLYLAYSHVRGTDLSTACAQNANRYPIPRDVPAPCPLNGSPCPPKCLVSRRGGSRRIFWTACCTNAGHSTSSLTAPPRIPDQ